MMDFLFQANMHAAFQYDRRVADPYTRLPLDAHESIAAAAAAGGGVNNNEQVSGEPRNILNGCVQLRLGQESGRERKRLHESERVSVHALSD